jgi:hypothetical protein
MSCRAAFFAAVEAEFVPRLQAVGFTGAGKDFRRINGDIVNAISLQDNRYHDKCALNIGLHALFLPSPSGELPDSATIKEIECEFRDRVVPLGVSDHWWDYGTTESVAERSARDMIDTYFSVAAPNFERFQSVDDLAEMLPLDKFEAHDFRKCFGRLTTVTRAALAMARIHEHLGNTQLATQFAAKGLERVGRASSLIPHFEKIIDGI